jgi:AcrR family transcriptional regulator
MMCRTRLICRFPARDRRWRTWSPEEASIGAVPFQDAKCALEGNRVFRERGYADTTLQDVAVAVGISRSTLYYYIGTKEDLLAEILEDPLIEMTRGIRAIADLEVPASERLHRAILLQMETFAEYFPEMFVFLAGRLHVGR